jgi:hypothetical protein
MRVRRMRLGGVEVEAGRRVVGSELGRVLRTMDALCEGGLWKPRSGTALCMFMEKKVVVPCDKAGGSRVDDAGYLARSLLSPPF